MLVNAVSEEIALRPMGWDERLDRAVALHDPGCRVRGVWSLVHESL
jgi:hypothetical protein